MFKVKEVGGMSEKEIADVLIGDILSEFTNDPDVYVDRDGNTLRFVKKVQVEDKQFEYGRVILLGGRIDMTQMADEAITDRILKTIGGK